MLPSSTTVIEKSRYDLIEEIKAALYEENGIHTFNEIYHGLFIHDPNYIIPQNEWKDKFDWFTGHFVKMAAGKDLLYAWVTSHKSSPYKPHGQAHSADHQTFYFVEK